ncbi:MAG TPA: hypothetical protein VHO69_13555 [Phototrophicaceae bacterium]|nr:hypothetical protein [Phototrophicaceae bacterium]
MRAIRPNIILFGLAAVGILLTFNPVQGQASPTSTPTEARPIYTYFPSVLVCDEALKGNGPSIGLVTIGETTLQQIEEIYSEYFDIIIEYSEASGETLVYFYRLDDKTIYQRVDVCVINEVVIASNRTFPTTSELEKLYDDATPEPPSPATFDPYTIEILVRHYGIPDVVTYSSAPTHRVAFWFERGIAAVLYVRYDPPASEYPPGFGVISNIIYFPFQDVAGYEDRWPFKETVSENGYLMGFAPDKELPTEPNPFDFEAMVATLTAEPSRTPTLASTPTATAKP